MGGGLTVNAGLRYDVFGMLNERNGRIGNYYLPEAAAALGATPGFNVPANAPFFQPGFDPLQIGLYVVPGTSVDISQIHVAPNDSTLRGDRNNVAPRVGFAWQPAFAPKFVVRGGWGLYYERPSAGFKVDLQRAAPFFIYQNVPAPLDMANPYPQLNVNPFQIPLERAYRPRRERRAALGQGRRHGVPATSPFSSKNNTFIDPLVEMPSMQQWSDQRAVGGQPAPARRPPLRRLARPGPARQDQPRGAGRSAGDAGQRLHRHLRRAAAR